MNQLIWSVALLLAMGQPVQQQPTIPYSTQPAQEHVRTCALFEEYNLRNAECFGLPTNDHRRKEMSEVMVQLARELTKRLRGKIYSAHVHELVSGNQQHSVKAMLYVSNPRELAENIDHLRFADDRVRRDKHVASSNEIRTAIVQHARTVTPHLLTQWERSGYAWSEVSDELWLYLTAYKIPPRTLGISPANVALLSQLASQKSAAKR